MTNPTPRDSAQLPPADFIADLTKSWEGPWANAADTIVQALRAQAASVEPVGSIDHVEWSASKEQWRHNIWADNKIPFGTKLYAGAPPAHIPADVPTEVRADGKTVRVDRWEVAVRRIVALLWGNRHEFEVDEVVNAVRALTPTPNDNDEGLVRAVMDAPQPPAMAASSPATAVDARVPVQILKDASEALGHFVSDHGWREADMRAMDNLDAYIARHAALQASRQPQAQQAVAEGAEDVKVLRKALDIAARYVRLQKAPWSPTVQKEDLAEVEAALATKEQRS